MHGFAALQALITDAMHPIASTSGHGVAAWFLAGVFAWSGIAKLRHPTRTAMAIVDFGVVRHVRPILGALLAAAETLLAALLALGVFPRLVLALTAALLWVFAFVIARSLWAGEHFACFCFGEADDRLSRWTLVRTTTLALLASVVALTSASVTREVATSTMIVIQAITALSLLSIIALISSVPRALQQMGDVLGSPMSPHIGGD